MSTTETDFPPLLPAVDNDLLTGLRQISAWYGLTEGQARHKIEIGLIQVYRMVGKSTLFSFKSEGLATAREKLKKVSPTPRTKMNEAAN